MLMDRQDAKPNLSEGTAGMAQSQQQAAKGDTQPKETKLREKGERFAALRFADRAEREQASDRKRVSRAKSRWARARRVRRAAARQRVSDCKVTVHAQSYNKPLPLR
jgi:Ni/Co efflux regulator RcnB